MWEYLQEEAVDKPNSAAAQWWNEMCGVYGPDPKKFPHFGCGAHYRPWARGPSMVCEIKMNGKYWEAFLADHLPQALDDQMKKVNYDLLSRTFKKLTPQAVFQAIPVTMPMTHLATADGRQMAGVAKYPIDAWEAEKNPCFTSEKWAMICMMMAEKGLGQGGITSEEYNAFQDLFNVSSHMVPHVFDRGT